MNRRVLMRVAAAVGVLMVFSTVGHAAELKVFTSVALKQALNELSPIFEQKTGNKLSISYDLAAVQKKRILDGEHRSQGLSGPLRRCETDRKTLERSVHGRRGRRSGYRRQSARAGFGFFDPRWDGGWRPAWRARIR